ncbi:MAG: 1-acyl-sn-glycerol-3-phosphate acyltransferase [Bacteroidales bacterium]|jgi:1-acyl-sn-glycerol-3-phosphate acyltransferase|nr:1-acyl-sn-glycerol-3-phosphate acyltransferase [Bacteroidales bacterium]
MGRNTIEKYSAGYALLKRVAGFWHNKIFYRKIIVMGLDNIDPKETLIYAPNHQNALMDALAVLFTHKGQPIFLARADIFRKKFIASILYFLKMLPVYRIRDGYSNLKSNDDIFNKTIDVLRNKNGLVILPEGDHAGFRRLRQLKKGICRISFQAEEATGFSLNIKIIPVGIEYSSYSRIRQVLSVVYGKPIEVSGYTELYRTNPDMAFNELKKRLAGEMKNVMVHIDSKDDYEAIDELRSIVNGRFSDDIKNPKIYRDRELIEKLNDIRTGNKDLYNKICSLSLMVREKTKRLNTTYRLLDKKKHPLGWLIAGVAGLIATFPLFLFGNIFNLTFLGLPEFKIRQIKDKQFHSSVRYGLSLVLAFVLLPVFLAVCLLVFDRWWIALAIFLLIPVAGLFAWNYYQLFRRITGGFRLRKLISRGDAGYLDLRNNYDELLSLIRSL